MWDNSGFSLKFFTTEFLLFLYLKYAKPFIHIQIQNLSVVFF